MPVCVCLACASFPPALPGAPGFRRPPIRREAHDGKPGVGQLRGAATRSSDWRPLSLQHRIQWQRVLGHS
ncbi:Hypothetical predicted protein [Podarcis lilfordi]|uniref:Uncharacterized protein n=1 Tax=Podarcis lilfordi TaxID=74358 RepID=A0AA35K283_9SAUR|nr:Hypothetical predicted protein [Podarcis lilfordi]